MKKEWGFSAFHRYGDKRILFDTGNNAEIFAHNVEAKGIDLIVPSPALQIAIAEAGL
jgi:7,8-dihydropterin-6-yl-methyl-4-(beta-D-ribofuranosyl)aminobenzene 5'-phosphate synthase